MAKKHLVHTLTEGGRYYRSRLMERCNTRAERHEFKTALAYVKSNPDLADEIVVNRRDRLWENDSHFRSNPLRRWLKSQVGRAWDDVYSEIRSKFDIRGQDGRLIQQCLRWDVTKWHDNTNHDYGLVVCEDGILRDLGTWRSVNRYRGPDYTTPKLVVSLHWVLNHGLHKSLNTYLKKRHIRVVEDFKPWPSRERYTLLARTPPRLLGGKHDVKKFVEDVLSGGWRPDCHERHWEWKKNLENFLYSD